MIFILYNFFFNIIVIAMTLSSYTSAPWKTSPDIPPEGKWF